jgi:cation transport regulator ChaC
MEMCKSNFIFGYGSLVNAKNLQIYLNRSLKANFDFNLSSLEGYRRCWNIAMDNQIDLPGYKYYLEKDIGIRPNGFVTFLNIRPSQCESIYGILFRVYDEELQLLDERERNYKRIDVTNSIDATLEGRVWTYIGLNEAEQRYLQGVKQQML